MTDLDDAIVIAAHLGRIAARRIGNVQDRQRLAVEVCAALCDELQLDRASVGTGAIEMMLAMGKPQ